MFSHFGMNILTNYWGYFLPWPKSWMNVYMHSNSKTLNTISVISILQMNTHVGPHHCILQHKTASRSCIWYDATHTQNDFKILYLIRGGTSDVGMLEDTTWVILTKYTRHVYMCTSYTILYHHLFKEKYIGQNYTPSVRKKLTKTIHTPAQTLHSIVHFRITSLPHAECQNASSTFDHR